MISIVLAEDHAVVREGVRSLLKNNADYCVVGSCGDGLEAINLVEMHKPDILIVDLSLPGLDGMEVTSRVHVNFPQTKIIVLSMHNNEEHILSVLKKGAKAYVLKEASGSDLIKAIRSTIHGTYFLSEAIPGDILLRFQKNREKTQSRYDTLSKREKEVLQLVAEGYTSPEIEEKLYISVRTVETHRGNILAKLGLRSQTDMVHYALQRGLVQSKPRYRKEDE